MVEFKIQLEEVFVESFGREQIEVYLQEVAKKMLLHLSAKEILDDYKHDEVLNDEAWQLARENAWQEEKHQYLR